MKIYITICSHADWMWICCLASTTVQKMQFPIKDFFSKCEEIFHGKLHFFVQCTAKNFQVFCNLLVSKHCENMIVSEV